MTERRKPTREQVERLLAQAHAMREGVAVGEDWVHGVMRVVRQDADAHPYASMLAWAEPLVWRVAAAAALGAVVFAGSVVAYTARQPQPVTSVWLEEFDAGPPLLAD